MKKLLSFLAVLSWAWLTGCVAVQQPIQPARFGMLEKGRDPNTGFSPSHLRLKCQQRPGLYVPGRKVRYHGKRQWIIR